MADGTMLRPARLSGAGGLRLAADVGGDPARPPVVLLHGGGQTRHSWHRASEELVAAGYHTVCYDARGHGESDWAVDGDYGVDAFVADLCAVCAALQQPPALVGASLGGITSLVALGEATMPGGALVMVDVVPRMEVEGLEHIRRFMTANPDGFATLDEAVDAVARYNPHRLRPRNPAGLLKNLRRHDDGRLYWHWDPAFIASPRRLQAVAQRPRFERAAARLQVPTLLVRGVRSDVVTRAAAEEFRDGIADCELVDVDGAGHMVAGDRNDRFSAAVVDFLARKLAVDR